MVQESFNDNNERFIGAPQRGEIVVPQWAQDYAARQAEQHYQAPQQKADYSQQGISYEQYIENMHHRGRMINYMGDMYSRRNQNDWYPGYGPGHGYDYPTRNIAGGRAPTYYPTDYSQQYNGNNPNQYYYNRNNGFPGQGGNGAGNWNNPAQFMNNGNPFYNFNNRNQPVDPSQYSNNGNPGYNWNNPNQFVNPNQYNNNGNPFYNFNNRNQPVDPSQFMNNGNPFYAWNNPNQVIDPSQYNNNGNPVYNWNNRYQPVDPGQYSNNGNPFYNWNTQQYNRTDLPPGVQDTIPGQGNGQVGMVMRIGPDGRQYTYDYTTGQYAPWPPQESGPQNYYRQPGRNYQPQYNQDIPPGVNGGQGPVGMDMRIGPDGRQYTYDYMTGRMTPWSSEQYQPQNRQQDWNRYRQNPQAYDGRQFQQNDGMVTQATIEHWQRSSQVIRSMVGRSIQDYDPRIPERLGCARFVSLVLNRADGLPIHDAGVDGLERSLQRHGFQRVPAGQAKPGDVIIAHRYGNQPGHAGIYVGDGKVANNSSSQRRIAIQDAKKFNSREYQTVNIYRKVV